MDKTTRDRIWANHRDRVREQVKAGSYELAPDASDELKTALRLLEVWTDDDGAPDTNAALDKIAGQDRWWRAFVGWEAMPPQARPDLIGAHADDNHRRILTGKSEADFFEPGRIEALLADWRLKHES
jgi:hypothetical protein